MAKKSPNKKQKVSDEVVAQAMQVAKATQRPGQTKEQTKLIAQGIQKGIEEYKKRHKEKARELDKQKRKLQSAQASQRKSTPETPNDDTQVQPGSNRRNALPWALLAVSWIGFFTYIVMR